MAPAGKVAPGRKAGIRQKDSDSTALPNSVLSGHLEKCTLDKYPLNCSEI